MTKPLACRACLSVDVKLHDITETFMAKEFETVTGISVSDNEVFPPYLCTYCCKRTQNCVRFRKKCLVAQNTMAELCSANKQLTEELIKSCDVKVLPHNFTRSATEHVDYIPSKFCEYSPSSYSDRLDIMMEYPLSIDPLNNVAVTYETSEDEVNSDWTTYAGMKEYEHVELEGLPRPEIITEPINNVKPKRRVRKNAKPRKDNSATEVGDGTLDLSVNKESTAEKKSYQCDVCGKLSINSRYLAIHRRIHTGEKPYKCEQCKKSFSVSSHLKIHMRVHTGEKPFKCDVCSKSFSQRTHIEAHRRTHTGEKPYKCETCQKTFSYSTHLVTHRRIHTGEKPYNCNVCAKSFSTQGSLISHKRGHTGEKPYKCETCRKCFSSSSGYCRHKRRHCTVQVSKMLQSV